MLDLERAYTYAALASKSSTLRFAFAAAHFGDYAEAAFWLQLPQALDRLSKGSGGPSAFWEDNKATSQGMQSIRKQGMEGTSVPTRNWNGLSPNPKGFISQNWSDLMLVRSWAALFLFSFLDVEI